MPNELLLERFQKWVGHLYVDEHKFGHFTKQSELLYPIYFVQNYSYFNQYCQIHNYLEFFFSKMKPVSMYLLWALLGNPGRFYPRILTMTKTPVMLLGSSLIQHPNYWVFKKDLLQCMKNISVIPSLFLPMEQLPIFTSLISHEEAPPHRSV